VKEGEKSISADRKWPGDYFFDSVLRGEFRPGDRSNGSATTDWRKKYSSMQFEENQAWDVAAVII